MWPHRVAKSTPTFHLQSRPHVRKWMTKSEMKASGVFLFFCFQSQRQVGLGKYIKSKGQVGSDANCQVITTATLTSGHKYRIARVCKALESS